MTTPAIERTAGGEEQMTSHGDAGRHEARYEIRLKGHLDGRWASWFGGLRLAHEPGGTTVIHGVGLDQAALHGLLQQVRDTGLPLISVTRVDPDDAHLAATDPTDVRPDGEEPT